MSANYSDSTGLPYSNNKEQTNSPNLIKRNNVNLKVPSQEPFGFAQKPPLSALNNNTEKINSYNTVV